MAATNVESALTTRVQRGPGRPGWKLTAAGVVLAWLVPLVVHLIGVDALSPLVVLAATMAVQRGSRTVLDRLVLALGQLVGATCAAGLLISVWPWHLSPVPVTGVALTVLVLIAGLRGLDKPSRGDRRDLLVVAGWLGVTLPAAVPLAGRGLAGRLGLVAPGEDLSRHFIIFDGIGQVGGYTWMHLDQARHLVPDGSDLGILQYPQGTHFIYALLGHYAGIGGDGPSGLAWLLWCMLGSYCLLALAVLWGARRVAGAGVRAVPLALVLLPIAAALICGDLLGVLFRGFPNELLGLALVAVLVGVLARPVHRLGEQVLTVLALLVGISFAYYLFLPFAGLAALVWAGWHRRHLFRRWPLPLAAALSVPLLLVTPLAIPQANSGSLLLSKGTALVVDRPVTVGLVVVAAVALLLRRGLRSPARRAVAVALGFVLLTVLGLGLYQLVMIGRTVYYFEKVLHLLVVVSLVATGALVRFVKPRPAWVAAGVVIGLGLAGLGGPSHTQLGSYGAHLVLGVEKGTPDAGRDALYMARRYPDPGGPVVVDLMHSPYANFFGTLYGSALRRDYRYGASWYGVLWPAGPPQSLDDLRRLIRQTPKPVLFLVSDPSVRSFAGVGGLTNVQVAQQLATEFPGKVLVASA